MFYCFRQNNSGGIFVINDKVTTYVIIEAHSAQEANRIAEDHSIYFNGCAYGGDCHCCGDRWYSTWDEEATEKPEIYGNPPEKYKSNWVRVGQPYAYVYFLDGTKTSYIRENERG